MKKIDEGIGRIGDAIRAKPKTSAAAIVTLIAALAGGGDYADLIESILAEPEPTKVEVRLDRIEDRLKDHQHYGASD